MMNEEKTFLIGEVPVTGTAVTGIFRGRSARALMTRWADIRRLGLTASSRIAGTTDSGLSVYFFVWHDAARDKDVLLCTADGLAMMLGADGERPLRDDELAGALVGAHLMVNIDGVETPSTVVRIEGETRGLAVFRTESAEGTGRYTLSSSHMRNLMAGYDVRLGRTTLTMIDR